MRQSLAGYFLKVGANESIPLIVIASILTLWGLINLAFVRNRITLAGQALFSFLPIPVACLSLVRAFLRFQVLVTTPGATPEQIGEQFTIAFLLGFVGMISTAIPAVVGILALFRNVPGSAGQIVENVADGR